MQLERGDSTWNLNDGLSIGQTRGTIQFRLSLLGHLGDLHPGPARMSVPTVTTAADGVAALFRQPHILCPSELRTTSHRRARACVSILFEPCESRSEAQENFTMWVSNRAQRSTGAGMLSSCCHFSSPARPPLPPPRLRSVLGPPRPADDRRVVRAGSREPAGANRETSCLGRWGHPIVAAHQPTDRRLAGRGPWQSRARPSCSNLHDRRVRAMTAARALHFDQAPLCVTRGVRRGGHPPVRPPPDPP